MGNGRKAMTKDLTKYANSTHEIHYVDGIGVQFCFRHAWKANLYVGGKIVDVVPVVTIRAAEWKIAAVNRILGVRFQNAAEVIEFSKAKEPFYVAVAWNAAAPGSEIAIPQGFFAVYLVQSTGAIDVAYKEIDVQILGKRISAVEFVTPRTAA
jgi:hypothetical protein